MKSIFIIFVVLVMSSCNKKVYPDCGCDGPTYEMLTNVLAVCKEWPNVNVISVRDMDPSGYFYLPCDPSFLQGINPGDTVLVSGKVHGNCYRGESLIALPAYLEITALRKK